MSIFKLYLSLGIDHIADLGAYDHILFIITLCAVYSISQWKKLLLLITAFTLGHTLTLALATLELVHIDTGLVEVLIPVTILLTALANILQKSGKLSPAVHNFKYSLAMFFGLIHGLGFSNYLRSLLGREENIIGPLFSFNLGIEIGQLIIVLAIMIANWILTDLLGVKKREWNLLLSGAGAGVSLIMIFERISAI